MIPAELRDARARLGMTQAQLADAMGIARNTVARWESGERACSELAARFIRRLLDDMAGN